MGDAYTHRNIGATVITQINNTDTMISKFNRTSLISIQCEISAYNHKQLFHYIRQGVLIIIISSSGEQFFAYITHVSDHKVNLFVSNKFSVTEPSNKRIRICLLKAIKKQLDSILDLVDLKESPLLPLMLKGPDSYNVKGYLVFEIENQQSFINLVKTIKVLIEPMKYSIGVVTQNIKQKQLIESRIYK